LLDKAMKIVKNVLADYFAGVIFFVIVFYFMTASPDGSFTFNWNVANTLWTLSFVVAYPLLLELVPSLKKNHLQMDSLATRALKQDEQQRNSTVDTYHAATNPVMNTYDIRAQSERRDDGANLFITFFVRGILIALAIPMLIFYGAYRLFKNKKG